jgi:hypothetical protein
MTAAIIACEAGFWVLLTAGLAARYLLKKRLLSTALLLSVPLIDLVLLAITVLDLRRGATPGPAHGLAAVYLGVSVAFGSQMIGWADQRFAHRFAGGPAPARPPRTGHAHAAHERRQWLRHLLAYAIAGALIAAMAALTGARTLWAPMAPWTIALIVDFIVSFSYSLSPRRR